MYHRVDYTDYRNGTDRKVTHIVGQNNSEVEQRLRSLLKASDPNQVVIHSITPEQPDFMQHEFDALSDAIGKNGENRDVIMTRLLSSISVNLDKIAHFQSKILEELQSITSRMND